MFCDKEIIVINMKNKINETQELKDVCMRFVGCRSDGYLALGLGVSARGGEILSKWGKTLCVIDKTVLKFGLHKPFLASLEEKNVSYEIFDEVEAEPDIETMERAYKRALGDGIRAVVGMGGGSVLDTAKAVALALGSGISVLRLFEKIDAAKESLPLVLMPTTSGTGSEVSPYSVASKNGKKIFIGDSKLYARVALVDPLLTVSMPPKVTAATGMDALSHAVEGMMSASNPVTFAYGCESVKLIFKYLSAAVKDGNDLRARYYMSFASVLGMLSYAQGGGLYAHSVSYILTEMLSLPHGVGCGLALPYCVNLNKEYISDVTDAICSALNISSDASVLAKKLRDLQGAVGLPTNLKAAGVKEEELEKFSKKLIDDYYRPKNPRQVNGETALKFIKAMYEEQL